MEARGDPSDLTGRLRTYNADKTCQLNRPHMTDASRLADNANRAAKGMPTNRWSGKETTVIAPSPVTLTFLHGDRRRSQRKTEDDEDSQDDTPQEKRTRSVSPTRSELSEQGRARGSRDVSKESSPPLEQPQQDVQMSEATSSQTAPPGGPPEEARLYRRKCFDGYYRMMTERQWADHLKEYEEEYEVNRQNEVERGRSLYPDLTEEEDDARFTAEEHLLSE